MKHKWCYFLGLWKEGSCLSLMPVAAACFTLLFLLLFVSEILKSERERERERVSYNEWIFQLLFFITTNSPLFAFFHTILLFNMEYFMTYFKFPFLCQLAVCARERCLLCSVIFLTQWLSDVCQYIFNIPFVSTFCLCLKTNNIKIKRRKMQTL